MYRFLAWILKTQFLKYEAQLDTAVLTQGTTVCKETGVSWNGVSE